MLLIGNGRVVTRDAENPYLKDGAVVTEGEKILDVGTLDAMKKAYPDAEFIDAWFDVILPQLVGIVHTIDIEHRPGRHRVVDGFLDGSMAIGEVSQWDHHRELALQTIDLVLDLAAFLLTRLGSNLLHQLLDGRKGVDGVWTVHQRQQLVRSCQLTGSW